MLPNDLGPGSMYRIFFQSSAVLILILTEIKVDWFMKFLLSI